MFTHKPKLCKRVLCASKQIFFFACCYWATLSFCREDMKMNTSCATKTFQLRRRRRDDSWLPVSCISCLLANYFIATQSIWLLKIGVAQQKAERSKRRLSSMESVGWSSVMIFVPVINDFSLRLFGTNINENSCSCCYCRCRRQCHWDYGNVKIDSAHRMHLSILDGRASMPCKRTMLMRHCRLFHALFQLPLTSSNPS